MTTTKVQTPIYFVASKILEPLATMFARNQPMPQTKEAIEELIVESYLAKGEIPLGERAWIVQTFLRMKQAKLNVMLVEEPVKNAICVCHFDTIHKKVWAPESFVVGIRADRSPLYMREIEFVQNPVNLGGKDTFLILYWPQPQLLPRDKTRGNRIERISFFGQRSNLQHEFSDQSFIKALKKLDVELDICCRAAKWNDFRQTDLILAIRDLHPLFLKTKPPTKLMNAWLAQCVAILGNEPGFRAIGIPGKDYFEVKHPQEVLEIVAKLKNNPSLYEKVRQAGAQRASQFTVEAIQQQWVDLLTGPVTTAFEDWKKDPRKNSAAYFTRRYWQFTQQWIAHKLYWSFIHGSDKLWRKH